MGGKDFNTYFAYDTAVIKEEDGLGKVHIDLNGSPTLLTGGTHKLGADDNTYQSLDGKITYVWDKEAKTLKASVGFDFSSLVEVRKNCNPPYLQIVLIPITFHRYNKKKLGVYNETISTT